MKNYKINIDKPKPSQEEILAGQNFDQLLAQYKGAPGKVIRKPFWKTGGFIGSVAAVAATVVIVLMVMKNSNTNPVTNDSQESVIANNGDNTNSTNDSNPTPVWTPTKRKVAPPLAGVDVPFKEYKVSAAKGGKISYPSGTSVTFQPNSFVDAAGNPVSGNVNVQYREMHDAVDFFLSGIPMSYDSAGATYQLESAGMMEIAAFVDGKVVYLDKNKPMEVAMAASTTDSKFNVYLFDKEAGNWEYQGKDVVAPMPYDKTQRMKDSLEMLKWWMAMMRGSGVNYGVDAGVYSMPVDGRKPPKADPSKNRFVVDFDKKEFPEMANYEKVIFEVDETKEKFDKANYDITWETVKLFRGETADRYILNLKKGMKSVNLDVYPVLDGEEYNKAYAIYEKQHARYLKDSASYMTWHLANPNALPPMVTPNQAPPVNQYAGLSDAELAKQFKFDPEEFRKWKKQQASENMVMDVQRTFTASGFGIYNIDAVSRLNATANVDMELRLADGTFYTDFQGLYHVDRERNTLVNYAEANPIVHFQCNTRSQNLMWVVKDGELYYAENDSFMNLPASGKVSTTLKKVAKKLTTPEEMRAFFGLKAPVNAK
jgi:hypothetical protein